MADTLPLGARLLHGQYLVEQHLVGGGFGMTYLARDSLDRQVVIKECYPSAFCCRAGREVRPRSETFHAQYESVVQNFINEARRLPSSSIRASCMSIRSSKRTTPLIWRWISSTVWTF